MEDRFALLIDADNVSAKYIKPILDELSKYGNVTYKRIYGDWTKSNSASWKEPLHRPRRCRQARGPFARRAVLGP